MPDVPTILSGLALIISMVIGLLNWRSGRLKPDVDSMSIALDAQQVAKNALDGQTVLAHEVTDLKKHLKGSYEIKTIVRFYPKPEITEMSIRLLPATKRKTPSPVDGN